jgi:hypothetical protein
VQNQHFHGRGVVDNSEGNNSPILPLGQHRWRHERLRYEIHATPRQNGLNPLESLIVSSRWPRLSGFAGRKVSYESYD